MDKLKFETPDMVGENIEKIGALFPSAVTEMKDENGKVKKGINFEVLKQLLSRDVVDGDECYEFTWVGKKAAMAEAARPTTKTLRPVKEDSRDWDTTENLYIEGDNLEVLKILQESYLGKVKMIYIDPPYNTGHDFVYPDSFVMDNEEYSAGTGYFDEDGNVNFARENSTSAGKYHSDWCSMIYSRLQLAKNLMSDDGVIFISIDDSELENLKKICEEIFSASNFIANIVWKHTQQSKNDEPYFSRQYNHTLCYAKNKPLVSPFFFERTEEDNKNYSNPDNDPRGRWRSGDVRSPNYRKTLCYPIIAPNGNVINPPENGWRWSEESVKEKIESGEIIFKPNYEGIIRKIYLCDQVGRTPENLWEGSRFGTTRQAAAMVKELFNGRQIFDTPKPIELIMSMMKIATNEDAIILDFFSGSATTAHAVMKLNAEDGGHRKFIMVQLPEPCDEKSEAFKAGYKNICEIGKERIRRAGDKIKEENPLGTKDLDTGFRVFRVDESNMKDVYYHPDELDQMSLMDMVSNIKDDRTDMDLLYACLLDWGVEINLPHTSTELDGCTIHNVDNGALIACFNEKIPASVIESMAQQHPLRAVFRDSAFTADDAKINVTETFKNFSPDTSVKVL